MDLEAFTPERSYADWANDLDELEGLRVDVVPISYDEAELEGREVVSYLCRSHVGIRKWFPRSQAEGASNRIPQVDIDRLVFFVQELNEFFCQESGRRLSAYPEAVWQETKIVTTYSRKYLRDNRMFFGLLRVNYSVAKAL